MAQIKPDIETFARIKVVGVGGGGNNAVSRMVDCKIQGVEFVGINADAQDLNFCKASEKVLIGKNLTRGLGAGMNPDIGRQAAEENRDEIQEVVKNTDMVFVTCGLGGGVGSGATAIVAEAAREAGALTVGVVTKPFTFEGTQRSKIANEALKDLQGKVDTLIIIPNDRILQVIDKKVSLLDAFGIVDDILRQGVQGISDLVTVPGIINVDFADVKAIMQNAGTALMGIGEHSGENRAVEAAKQAVSNPLLELSIDGAKGVLFNVTGSSDMGMSEINEAARVITDSIDPDAKVIFGAVIDPNLKENYMKVTVVATDFENIASARKPNKIPVIPDYSEEEDEDENKQEDQSEEVGENNKHIKQKSKREQESVEEKSEKPEKRSPFGKIKPIDEEDENQDKDNKKDKKDEKDMLDIPAFIRKRMLK